MSSSRGKGDVSTPSTISPEEKRKRSDGWLQRNCPEFVAYDPQVRVMGTVVARWAMLAVRNTIGLPKLMVVCGRSGCGKSLMSRAVHRYWWSLPFEAKAEHWPGNAMPSVHSCAWSKIADTPIEQKGGYFSDVAASDLLVLDDVGTEVDQFKTGRPTENLREMLERRHTRRGFTLITTNVLENEWGEKWEARVADRLLRKSHICECNPAMSFSQLHRKTNNKAQEP